MVLPLLFSLGLPALAGSGALGATLGAMSVPALAGIGAGLGSFVQTGDLGKGMQTGMASFLGGKILGGLSGSTSTNALNAGANTPTSQTDGFLKTAFSKGTPVSDIASGASSPLVTKFLGTETANAPFGTGTKGGALTAGQQGFMPGMIGQSMTDMQMMQQGYENRAAESEANKVSAPMPNPMIRTINPNPYGGSPGEGKYFQYQRPPRRDGSVPKYPYYYAEGGKVLDELGKQLNERGETAAEEALRRSKERVTAAPDLPSSLQSTANEVSDRVYIKDLSPLQQQMLQKAVEKAEKSLEGAISEKYHSEGEYYDPSAVEDKKRRLDRANRMLEGTQPISQGMFQNISRDVKASIKDDFKDLFKDPREAKTLLRTAQSYGRDPRNWESIMASDDPVLAARLATRQAIDAGAYDRNAPLFRKSGFDSGNYRDVQMPAKGIMGLAQVNRPTGRGRENIQYHAVTPGGRRLTQFTGYDPNLAYENQLESVQSGMARFGLDPTTEDAYEDSQSYLFEGMNPSLYYGMEWDSTYNPDSRNQSKAVKSPFYFAEGGEIEVDEMMEEAGMNEKDVIVEAIEAVKGMSEQPEIALAMFVQKYGEDALRDLVTKVQSGELDDTVARFAAGEKGMVKGPGDGSGKDDMIPATLDGQQDVLLTEDEFVLRQPTTNALEKAFGGGFLDKINEAEEDAPKVLERMVG